jgi:hypothetical protein
VLFLDGLVLDEKNMPGKTLGIRRLQSKRKDLYPLRRAFLTLAQFLNSRGYKHFVDSSGRPFTYDKTINCKLKCYRIKEIDKREDKSLLIIYGINYPITIERPPVHNPTWVRLLHIGDSPWQLYDYPLTKLKDTYKRV